MRRVLSCVGPDAKIEVYVPQNGKLNKRVVGAYSLDLTDAGRARRSSRSTCNTLATESP